MAPNFNIVCTPFSCQSDTESITFNRPQYKYQNVQREIANEAEPLTTVRESIVIECNESHLVKISKNLRES